MRVWVWLKYEFTFSMPLFWKDIINSLKIQSRFHISLFNPFFILESTGNVFCSPLETICTQRIKFSLKGGQPRKYRMYNLPINDHRDKVTYFSRFISHTSVQSKKLFFPMLWADPAIHQDLRAINKTIHENLLCSVVYISGGRENVNIFLLPGYVDCYLPH